MKATNIPTTKTALNKVTNRALSKDYNKDYLYRVCGGGEEFKNNSFSQRFFEAINIANLNPKDNVLDIGGGRGEIAFLSAKIGAHVTVIDYSKTAINIIKNYSKKPSFKNFIIDSRLMDAKKLDFKEGSFDKIFLLEVIEHLTTSEINQVFKETLRVLKKDGTLILSTGPNKLIIKPIFFLAKLLFPKKEWESRKFHINEQSFWSLKKLFNKFNLTYTIYPIEASNWFYGQIINNGNINNSTKKFIKRLNQTYDYWVFRRVRQLPFLNMIFCHGFLVKLNKK